MLEMVAQRIAVIPERLKHRNQELIKTRTSSAICYFSPPPEVGSRAGETVKSAPLAAANELECVLPNKLQLKNTNLLRR